MRAPACAAIAVLVAPALSQTPLFESFRAAHFASGWLLHALGDVDADGRPDFVLASQSRNERGGLGELCFLRSPSASGFSVERAFHVAHQRVDGRITRRGFEPGAAVVRLPGGGLQLAVGAPGAGGDGKSCGVVELFRGFPTPLPQRCLKGDRAGDEFGGALALVPDLDGDGEPELAIGAPGASVGRVEIVRTKDGAVLRVLEPPVRPGRYAPQRFGAALAATARRSGWGTSQVLAVGDPDCDGGRGAVVLCTLGEGVVFTALSGLEPFEGLGARLLAEDLDLDGGVELIAAGAGARTTAARVACIDADSGVRGWTFVAPSPAASQRELSLATCGDLDGDGVREVLFAYTQIGDPRQGALHVLSGRDGRELHAIRSVDRDFGDPEGPRRSYRRDSAGLPLGGRSSAADAGDLDGDGISDIWLAVGSTDGAAHGPALVLFSGRELGAPNKAEMSTATDIVLSRSAPIEGQARVLDSIPIEELPTHFVYRARDGLREGDRGWVCQSSAFGEYVTALGDLNGDGRDEIWVSGVAQLVAEYDSRVLSGADGAELALHTGLHFTAAVSVGQRSGGQTVELLLGGCERTYRFCETLGKLRLAQALAPKELRSVWTAPLGGYGGGCAGGITVLGDVNSDGLPEIAVGLLGWSPGPMPLSRDERRSEVVILAALSEPTHTLRRIPGRFEYDDAFGWSLDWGGDWDGDGRADLAVGAPLDSTHAAQAGAVHIYSGATWKRLATFASSVEREGFGRQLAWAPDLDGDARSELVVTAPWSGAAAGEDRFRGRVVAISSKRAAPLWELRGPWSGAAFGASLALADFDGDGLPEAAIGAPGAWSAEPGPHGRVSVHSLADGRELLALRGPEALPPVDEDEEWSDGPLSASRWGQPTIPRFGRALAAPRDLDGDGRADLVIGDPCNVGLHSVGAVYALSGAELAKRFAPR